MSPYTVRVTCPDCGDVAPRIQDVVLLCSLDNGAYTVSFPCPLCARRTVVVPPGRSVPLLEAAGVEERIWWYPDELDDALRTDATPPGALLDLLDHDWDAELSDL